MKKRRTKIYKAVSEKLDKLFEDRPNIYAEAIKSNLDDDAAEALQNIVSMAWIRHSQECAKLIESFLTPLCERLQKKVQDVEDAMSSLENDIWD